MGSGRGVFRGVLIVLPSGDVVVVIMAPPPPPVRSTRVEVVVMMVIATTIITIRSGAVRPAGGGGVSTVGVVAARIVMVDPALAGRVFTVNVTTSHRGCAAAVPMPLHVGSQLRVAAHGDAFQPIIAISAPPGPRGAPPTNTSRSGNGLGSPMAPATARADA